MSLKQYSVNVFRSGTKKDITMSHPVIKKTPREIHQPLKVNFWQITAFLRTT